MGERLTYMGKIKEYELDGDTLSFGEVTEPQRVTLSLIDEAPTRTNVRTVDLGQVRRASLSTLGNMSSCDLTLADGSLTSVITDERASAAAYRRLVEAIHLRLAERSDVTYTRGSWAQVVMVILIGVVALIAGAAIHQRWIHVPAALAGKAFILMIVAALWVVVGPVLVWRSRPRPYDPRALPRGYV